MNCVQTKFDFDILLSNVHCEEFLLKNTALTDILLTIWIHRSALEDHSVVRQEHSSICRQQARPTLILSSSPKLPAVRYEVGTQSITEHLLPL